MKDYTKEINALQIALESFKELQKQQGEQPRTISFEEGVENTGSKAPSNLIVNDKEIRRAEADLRRWAKQKKRRCFLLFASDENRQMSMEDYVGEYNDMKQCLIDAFENDHVLRNLVKKALKEVER